MAQKILAICLLVIVIALVITNTLILQNVTESLTEDVENLQLDSKGALDDAIKIDDNFKKKVSFIGLTVSHEDLTNIEDCFAEMTGYLTVGDSDGAKVAKYRLIRSLKHLRRLVGFNIDAII